MKNWRTSCIQKDNYLRIYAALAALVLAVSLLNLCLGAEYGDFLSSLERPRAVALRYNPLKGERPALPFVGQPVPWEPEGFYYDPEARPGLHVYHGIDVGNGGFHSVIDHNTSFNAQF